MAMIKDLLGKMIDKINDVPDVQSAEVGQVIAVKAVDDNGKPTEWECVDNKKYYYISGVDGDYAVDDDSFFDLSIEEMIMSTFYTMIDGNHHYYYPVSYGANGSPYRLLQIEEISIALLIDCANKVILVD